MADTQSTAELVVFHVCEMANATARARLSELKTGKRTEGHGVNPFTGQPLPPTTYQRVHQKLKAAGLLDDAAFCDDLTELVTKSVELALFNLLVWHDGGWMPKDKTQIEIRVKGGDTCEDQMHELIGRFRQEIRWEDID